VTVEPLGGSRFIDDYRAGHHRLAPFYEGWPDDLSAYRAKLEEVRARFDRPARERAAAALRPTSEAAAERLRRFVEEGGAMVTTGQQAGLFTGPLYTVHKILSAIRLAEALERELGTLVIPVFWAASEDADFAEVNHAYAVDADGNLHRSTVAPTSSIPVPMSEMRLGTDVESAAGGFAQAIGIDGDHVDHLRLILGSDYRPGATVASAFEASILRLFAGFDLCVTHAADEALKRASAWVLLREAENAAEHERLIAEQTARLEAAGYPSQVVLLTDSTNLFYHGPAGRERLHREDGRFAAPESKRRFTLDELRGMLEDDPRVLSPNVFLRPVVESAVFPTLAYVGGPAETAYFGQMRPLFQSFGIRMPLVFPRFAAMLVPDEVGRAYEALDLELSEYRRPEHELLEMLARRRMPQEVWHEVRALRRLLVDGFGRVMDAAQGIDRNLEPALGGRRDRALLEVERAERKIVRHFKKRHPELARSLRLVRNHLRPLGKPQERVLTVFQYLGEDPKLLQRLADGMRVELRGEPVAAPVEAVAAT
jgi:bacillithiol synthase